MEKKSYWWQEKKSKGHSEKYKKIECKSINAVWKQNETTTKSMNALHRFFKKAQKARFAWAKFPNIEPKFRPGIQLNRNVEIIT